MTSSPLEGKSVAVSIALALAALLEDQASLGLDGIPSRLLAPKPLRAPPRLPPTPIAAPTVAPIPAAPMAPATKNEPARPPCSAPVLPIGLGSEALRAIREDLGDCTRCKLCQGRKNIVFGVGHPSARLVFVGEGPGFDEDAQGEPFVGKAGQLLTKMIGAMGLAREDVYICNVLKCRPPNNRDPEPDEVQACEPFLIRQLEAIKPEVIVALGKHAAHTLLRDKAPITRLRGRWKTYQGFKLMPTFHPAYLLRNPAEKRAAWADLQEVMKVLGLHA